MSRRPTSTRCARYGPGTEREAVLALQALRLTDPDEVSPRARRARLRVARRPDVRRRSGSPAWPTTSARASSRPGVVTTRGPSRSTSRRSLRAIPRPSTRKSTVHRGVVLRLIARLDWMATQTFMPSAITTLPAASRRLLVWALQFLRDEPGLDEHARRVRCRARRRRRAAPRARRLSTCCDRCRTQSRRRCAGAASSPARSARRCWRRKRHACSGRRRAATRPCSPPTRPSWKRRSGSARVHARQGRFEAAAARLRGLAGRIRDGQIRDTRQAYLTALFLAEAEERLGRRAEAVAQYEAARRVWPAAQTPVLGLARLRTLEGAHSEAREALATLGRAAADGPSDPWHGFDNGQAWRLPAAIAALQASFEPL